MKLSLWAELAGVRRSSVSKSRKGAVYWQLHLSKIFMLRRHEREKVMSSSRLVPNELYLPLLYGTCKADVAPEN